MRRVHPSFNGSLSLLVLLSTVLDLVVYGGELGYFRCGRGSYVRPGVDGEPLSCRPCPAGTFMDLATHAQKWCKKCSVPDLDNPYYMVVDSCSRFHDVRIKCKDGLYRDPRGWCNSCGHCEAPDSFVARNCSNELNHDVVCCPRPGMSVRHGQCVDSPSDPQRPTAGSDVAAKRKMTKPTKPDTPTQRLGQKPSMENPMKTKIGHDKSGGYITIDPIIIAVVISFVILVALIASFIISNLRIRLRGGFHPVPLSDRKV